MRDQPISSAYVITRYITASTSTRVAVRVRRVGLEQDRVTGLEAVGVAGDIDLDRAGGDDEVLAGAGRVRVGILDAAGREAELVELDAARLVEREQRARR